MKERESNESWALLLGRKEESASNYSLSNMLNMPIENLNISGRLLSGLRRLNVETPLDLLSLIYKDDPGLKRIMGKKSQHEIFNLFLLINGNIIKSLPERWRAIGEENILHITM